MSYIIAISGKGGVGKTTIGALIVRRLIARGCRPVLAVDADPNTCLDTALGVAAHATVGGVREEARRIVKSGDAGISKQELLEMKISESLVEAEDFDLIAMGRPEGPGCYCYANNVLKSTLEQVAASYPYVLLDNEAGLENLSRRIVQKVDLLVMVSDSSRQGLATAERLHNLAAEMEIGYDRLALVVNRARSPQPPAYATEIAEAIGAHSLLALPYDDRLAELAEAGESMAALRDRGEVIRGIDALLRDAGLGRSTEENKRV